MQSIINPVNKFLILQLTDCLTLKTCLAYENVKQRFSKIFAIEVFEIIRQQRN